MKTSEFLDTLRSHPTLPLVFRAGRDVVSPGYHLTEVKRVAYETMDCGAMLHRWSETQFELWIPAREQPDAGRGHLPAEKFLRIIERVESELPLDGAALARIHASFGDQLAALYAIETIAVRDHRLEIALSPDRTRCKAAERRIADGTGGCCGAGNADAPEADRGGAGCSDDSRTPAQPQPVAARCCA